MYGLPPFMHNDTYEIFQKTLKEKIRFPTGFSSDAKSLIKHLTKHDLSKRYGNLVEGTDSVRNHRFFSAIDFKNLASMRKEAPYIPTLSQVKVIGKGSLVSALPHEETEPSAELIEKSHIFDEWF